MMSRKHGFTSSSHQVMTEQQFDEIISAIIDGKYSWACLLMLEFTGYNPLHYIPRRTYTRLKRENRRESFEAPAKVENRSFGDRPSNLTVSMSHSYPRQKTQIKDLRHIEEVKSKSLPVRGKGVLTGDVYHHDLEGGQKSSLLKSVENQLVKLGLLNV